MQNLYILTTAALLHDIGKIFQKSGKTPELVLKWIDTHEEYKGKKYHHYLGAAFVESVASEIEGEKALKLKTIANLIKTHHDKQGSNWSEDNWFYKELGGERSLADILRESDSLASKDRKYDEYGVSNDLVKSIFIIDEKKERVYLPIANDWTKHTLERYNIFIETPQTKDKYYTYSEHVNIVDSLEKTLIKHLLNYEETFGWILKLITILREASIFIPAYKQSKYPTMSLFAHSLVTAAYASAKYLSNEHKTDLLVIRLGGLQKFISNLEDKDYRGKNAAKLLRGRSVFIELLTKAIAYQIIKKLDLTPANIVLLTSGKALIIIPHNYKNEELNIYLDNVKQKISEKLNPLVFGFGRTEIEHKEIYNTIKKGFFLASREIEMIKRIDSKYLSGNKCEICGNIGNVSEYKNKENESMFICKTCKNLIKLGELTIKRKDGEINILSFNYFTKRNANSIVKEITETEVWIDVVDQSIDSEFTEYWVPFDKFDEFKKKYETNEYFTYKLLPSNIEPNLEELAKIKQDKYYSHLAFVKGDFDRLGKLIKKNSENYGLSGYLTLALYMELLVAKILNKAYKISKKGFYQLYAGGDDIAFIGLPNESLSALNKIRKELEELQRFDENVDIPLKLSCAYILIGLGTPINIIFRKAEENLSNAKKYRNSVNLTYIPGKNDYSKIIKFINDEDKTYSFKDLFKDYNLGDMDSMKAFIYKLNEIRSNKNLRKSRQLKELEEEFKAEYMWNKRLKDKKGNWGDLYTIWTNDKNFFFQLMFTKILEKRWKE